MGLQSLLHSQDRCSTPTHQPTNPPTHQPNHPHTHLLYKNKIKYTIEDGSSAGSMSGVCSPQQAEQIRPAGVVRQCWMSDGGTWNWCNASFVILPPITRAQDRPDCSPARSFQSGRHQSPATRFETGRFAAQLRCWSLVRSDFQTLP